MDSGKGLVMCIFSSEVTSVKSTKIYARYASRERQLLVYSMAYEAQDDLAMILPLPTPPGQSGSALKFIDLSGYPEFFDDIDRSFPLPRVVYRSPGETRATLPVYEVGSFEASFAPSQADFAQLDPRFRLPEVVWGALPHYHDYGFAVFKLKAGARNVHPIAFTFPTRDSTTLFFPTTHIHHGEVTAKAEFDHVLYWQAAVPMSPDSAPFNYWRIEVSERPIARHVDLDRAAGVLVPNLSLRRISIYGPYPNQDIVLIPQNLDES
ncbi:MAG TPA: hypothetical protein P5333_23640 [Caldilinea sp.]|nr:hypothetical protein [Caldilinea sp.]